MKGKIRFIAIAENAIVDDKTGKLSLIGIFTDIALSKGSKKTAMSFVIAGQLLIDGAEEETSGVLEVKIVNPDGTDLRSEKMSGPIERDKRIQFTAFFPFTEFEQVGEYSVKVSLNGSPCIQSEKLCFFNVNSNG